MAWLETPSTAFEGGRCIAGGSLREVALATKPVVDRWASSISPPPILVFEDASSEVIELDWRGTLADFEARLNALNPVMTQAMPPIPVEEPPVVVDAPRGPGRPKLGVSAREVTLLPRHWEWLARQPGGASVALRKLVETARLASETKDRVRHCSAVTYKFMSTMAGHEPGFEEASRVLFAGDSVGFAARVASWPADVQAHLLKISTHAFAA
ncbi:DUF2239 family protein [Rhodoferax saidenbachensis]|uniref:DUF2239 domain-containing protein n=1 Tax=Rhodoferax saidenbachensis TaxID=1484693 RepID=A0ABU1ZT43_9BURK|nr:DUF2239 family protein [Rhodoferax saidenbachensis]MDR7308096.1 hypothetical protein [Rhodoferax saidenbachensis]